MWEVFADRSHKQNSQGDFKKSLITKVKINRKLRQKQAQTTANRAGKQETRDGTKTRTRKLENKTKETKTCLDQQLDLTN